MPRTLQPADISCGNIFRLMEELVHHRPLAADDLTGVARIIFDWCAENDLACEIARAHGGEYTLVARPK